MQACSEEAIVRHGSKRSGMASKLYGTDMEPEYHAWPNRVGRESGDAICFTYSILADGLGDGVGCAALAGRHE